MVSRRSNTFVVRSRIGEQADSTISGIGPEIKTKWTYIADEDKFADRKKSQRCTLPQRNALFESISPVQAVT